jgi:hypothetical protein
MPGVKPARPYFQANHPLNQGIVGAWLLTERGGAVVDDVSNFQFNFGAVVGTPQAMQSPEGPAWGFDGSTSYISIAPGLVQRYITRYTIAASIFVTSFSDFRTILARGVGTNRNYSFYVEQTTGKLVNVFTTSTNVFKVHTGTTALSLNRWYRVAAVFDGANLSTFIDGLADGSTAAAFTPENGGAPQLIGSINVANKFAGGISEVRLWERALTPDEIIAWTNTNYSEFLPNSYNNLLRSLTPASARQNAAVVIISG